MCGGEQATAAQTLLGRVPDTNQRVRAGEKSVREGETDKRSHTGPGNAKRTCLSNTGNIPKVFCNGIFRISKGKCRKTEQHAIVWRCGKFAVLVDLHILPLGSQDNASWFSPENRKEVGSLIRDALEPRVRQFQEARYQKIHPKPRKDFTLTAPLCLEDVAAPLTARQGTAAPLRRCSSFSLLVVQC
ncbi:Protein SLX4IP [Anabarilius grahami]|uniref:Protein SLX4IP n=1 Tax=Anabarilius grahami TaxID=495550 RepID=A0A3N0YU18_ANAGA|nr:Protein SLX4IP [Anabarilius grahami]